MNNNFCFVHIEKAAGITLQYIFINNFIFYSSLKPWFYNSNEKYLTEKKFEILKFLIPFLKSGFGGHTVREFEKYRFNNQPVRYITFLRDPVDRYLSHYFYQKDFMGKERSFEDFLTDENFSNFMVKRISSTGNLEDAKRRINEFAFVGLVEEFDKSLYGLNKVLFDGSIDIRYESSNIGKSNLLYTELSESYKNQIIEKNILDLSLYSFVKEKIFPEYFVSSSNPEILNFLQKLKNDNESFQFSRNKQRINKIYRYLYVYPIDYMVNLPDLINQKLQSKK